MAATTQDATIRRRKRIARKFAENCSTLERFQDQIASGSRSELEEAMPDVLLAVEGLVLNIRSAREAAA